MYTMLNNKINKVIYNFSILDKYDKNNVIFTVDFSKDDIIIHL